VKNANLPHASKLPDFYVGQVANLPEAVGFFAALRQVGNLPHVSYLIFNP
jgi:hypothetical protein